MPVFTPTTPEGFTPLELVPIETITETIDSYENIDGSDHFPAHEGHNFISRDGGSWVICRNDEGYCWVDQYDTLCDALASYYNLIEDPNYITPEPTAPPVLGF